MNDLITFLNARIDEDETFANEMLASVAESRRPTGLSSTLWDEQERDALRVLREVTAKRATVKRYERGSGGELPEWKAGRDLIQGALAIVVAILRDIAGVYSDHPDYRPEWAHR